jgi:predicted PurR-regulated permease PerM
MERRAREDRRYLYQRILLAVINSSLMLIVMLLAGIPFAVPLAVFTGFTAAFIPIVATYLAGIVPIVVALAAAGPARATILLAWIVTTSSSRTTCSNPG